MRLDQAYDTFMIALSAVIHPIDSASSLIDIFFAESDEWCVF